MFSLPGSLLRRRTGCDPRPGREPDEYQPTLRSFKLSKVHWFTLRSKSADTISFYLCTVSLTNSVSSTVVTTWA